MKGYRTVLRAFPIILFFGALSVSASPWSDGFARGQSAAKDGFNSGYPMGSGCARRRNAPYDAPDHGVNRNSLDRTQEPSRECGSDYGCPYGSTCVKEQYQVHGFCAKNVNAYSIPTHTPPDPNSVNVGGEGDCSWDTECAIGFKCVKSLGQLRGHCLK